MPKFNYVVKNKEAKTIKGQEIVSSKEELISRLRGRGLYIISLAQEGEKDKKNQDSLRKIKGKRNSLKLQDLTFLAQNLATMLSSGVTLLRSLRLVSYQTESLRLANVLEKCSDDIRDGLSFAKAVKKNPKVFSKFWAGVIEVGEASGNLPFVLDKLADYLEMRQEFERKIKGALTYPVILMIVAAGAVFVFFKFLFPKFRELFTQFEIELPVPTKILFAISDFVETYFLLIILGFVGLGIAFYFLKDDPRLKRALDRIALKLPMLGKLFFLVYVERLTSTIYILLDSGLPVVYSLEITASSVGNSVIEEKVLAVSQNVKNGSAISEEFSKQEIFPVLVAEMAKIGEETGTMPDVFKRVSLHYRKDLSSKVDQLVAIFEPVMIIIMGVVIGAIVISLFMPLFKLATLS
ncbi:MAG: type II secretion system F family protein [Candidatus Omnitrophica bacterium]|nr:type II secretion system F family protein [Candidatus Omnitrophota bacterium]